MYIYLCVCDIYGCTGRRQGPLVCCQTELGEKNPKNHFIDTEAGVRGMLWKGWGGRKRRSGTVPSQVPGGGAARQRLQPWNPKPERVWAVLAILPIFLSSVFPPQHLPSDSVSVCFMFRSPFHKKKKKSHVINFTITMRVFSSPGDQIQ